MAEAKQESHKYDLVESKTVLQEAKQLQEKSFNGREEVLGMKHPDTLTSYFNLAQVLHAEQQYDTALELYRRALDGLERNPGVGNPVTIACREKKVPLEQTIHGQSSA